MSEHYDESCDHLAETRIDPPKPASGHSQGPTRHEAAGNETGGTAPGSEVRYFGTYQLLGEIARGGMGVVYKARQNTLNRTVAVKVILSGQLASKDEVRRFLVEAEAAANLNHPGIVPVYEFGEHDGTHYFSMAYVDGPSLADRVADGPLEADEATSMLIQIAEAVDYAHGQGVIHRDLKPGNILLERGAIPRVADFGLVKRIKDDAELTQSGTILGSVYYMPPEQAAGKTGEIGPGSDVYALGAILYRVLAGRPPFQAATAFETMQQVINEEPVPPRQLNSSIPADLETICLKCLEKDKARRYPTAGELAEDLGRYRDGLPIHARPLGRFARGWRMYWRDPVPYSLAAGLVLVLLGGLLAATLLWSRAESERRRAVYQEQMVQVLSNLVLEKTLDETEEWLRLFFRPVEQELLVARTWGESGLLAKDRPEDLNALLGPIIEHYPQVSSLMVADSRGREHMLLSMGGGETDAAEWRNRVTRRDEWDGQVQWIEWTDSDPQPRSHMAELPDYDPRERPWYTGALEQRERNGTGAGGGLIHWTSPYQFFTTKDLGITASVTFRHRGELQHVVAFDVLLEDISEFTTTRHPTDNGKVLVLTEDKKLIGLPNAPSLATPEDWKGTFLKMPGEIGLDVAARATGQFTFAGAANTEILEFTEDGRNWWAGLRPFDLGSGRRLWILVLAPESDLRENLAAPRDAARN